MASNPNNEEDLQIGFLGYKVNLGSLSIIPLVVGYSLCSSLLTIVNKAAVDVFPYPNVLTAMQYVTCVIAVLGLGFFKLLEHDPFDMEKAKKFFPAAFTFYISIFTNTTLLKYANVDTFIVFRSSTPILVAIADYIFRSQPWPSNLTFASLFVILSGAVGYVLTDNSFNLQAYSWAFAYLVTISFDMVYIKHIVNGIGLNTWGLVLYNNFLSLLVAPAFWLLSGEFIGSPFSKPELWVKFEVMFPVLLSCAFGLAISFFGFACRKALSATSFTVVGVTNKLLTVVINVLIWSKHASAFGTVCLLVTIVGGVMYQQSVVKSPSPPKLPPSPSSAEEDEESLLPKEENGKVVSSEMSNLKKSLSAKRTTSVNSESSKI